MTIMKRHLLLAVMMAAFLVAVSTAVAGDQKPVTGGAPDNNPGSPYLAQGPGDGDGDDMPGGRMHGGPFGDPMQQRKHIEQLRMLKMLELLNLTSEQEIPFLTAFNQMRIEQKSLDEKSDVLLDSMSAELALAKPNETLLKSQIVKVKAIEKQRFEQMLTFVDKVDSLLTTEQIAKLMIFQKRFEMELLEQVGRFRRGGGPGGHDGPGNPPDSGGF
jgi:hypothetical protein